MALTKVSRGLLSTGIVDNSTATAITIDSGGSVLIGKATPTDLHNTWNHLIIGEKGAIISENGSGGIDGISISDNAYIDSDTGAYAYQTTAAASIVRQTAGITQFANAASGSAGAALTFGETARIDASGNLLVGKTSADNTTQGVRIYSTGRQSIVSEADTALIINRRTSEGTIVDFRKDGTTIGKIGVVATNNLFINGDTIGLAIGDDNVYPANSSGASTDGATDLGDAVARWKDLYLSGGAFLGGTTSANFLDDYEEGTWTPVLSGTGYSFGTHTGSYVKVGNKVFVTALLVISTVGTNTSLITITGFPFTAHSATNQFQVGIVRETSVTGRVYVAQINVSTVSGGLNSMDGIASGSNEIFTAGNYGLSLTYISA